jgi:hypothetical protein
MEGKVRKETSIVRPIKRREGTLCVRLNQYNATETNSKTKKRKRNRKKVERKSPGGRE